MAKQNLFIGSLAYATTDDSLKAFSKPLDLFLAHVLSLTAKAAAARASALLNLKTKTTTKSRWPAKR